MIRLKQLLKEETFTATNKQSGKTSVFKSKDSRDAAIKAGTHDAMKDKGQPSAPKVAGSDMFGGDYAKDRGGETSKDNTDWMDDLDSIDISDIKGKADPSADSWTHNDVFGATFKDPKTGKPISVGDAYEREDNSPAYQKAFAYLSQFDPDGEAIMGTQAYNNLQKNVSTKSEPKSDMGVDKVVYNKRTKTVGIVRMGDERGETKTDADGNVNTDELEPYNPTKYPHQKDAQVAPSTTKEIDSRGLWKPFSSSSNNLKTKDGDDLKTAIGDSITKRSKNADFDKSGPYTILVRTGQYNDKIVANSKRIDNIDDLTQSYDKMRNKYDRKGTTFIEDGWGRTVFSESAVKESSSKLTKLMENDPCWKGYKQVGMKDKNGREVPNCVPEGFVNELGGISSIHKLYLAVSENHRKLKADQLAMAKKYNNETDPAKKAKLMDMLKKGTEKLRTVADNLSGVEERYIMSIDKDAELDLNPF